MELANAVSRNFGKKSKNVPFYDRKITHIVKIVTADSMPNLFYRKT